MKPSVSINRDRRSNSRSERVRFIISSEGYSSEPRYFQMLSENVPDSISGPIVEVIPLKRYNLQSGSSDPSVVARLTADYIRMLGDGRYTAELLIGRVVESFHQVRSQKKFPKEVIAKELREHLEDKGLVDGLGNITDSSEAFYACLDYLDAHYSVKNLDLVEDRIIYDPDIDKVCIVVDRDKTRHRGPEKYSEFLDVCEKYGYLPFVTNPRFEFWLILHFDISAHIKGLRDESSCDEIVKGLCSEHQIGKRSDFKEYGARVGTAISNAGLFENDPGRLESAIGTNLGILMRMIGFR